MIWFLIALLVALGGIFYAYTRAKAMPVIIPKDTTPPGTPRIDLKDPAEVKRWSKELGVDEYDLKGAVQEEGASVDKVRKNLGEK